MVAGATASISVLFIPASLAPIVCVYQCGLLGYGACYVSFILNSFEVEEGEEIPCLISLFINKIFVTSERTIIRDYRFIGVYY